MCVHDGFFVLRSLYVKLFDYCVCPFVEYTSMETVAGRVRLQVWVTGYNHLSFLSLCVLSVV